MYSKVNENTIRTTDCILKANPEAKSTVISGTYSHKQLPVEHWKARMKRFIRTKAGMFHTYQRQMPNSSSQRDIKNAPQTKIVLLPKICTTKIASIAAIPLVAAKTYEPCRGVMGKESSPA